MHKRNKKNKHKNPTPPQQVAAPAAPVNEQEIIGKVEDRVPEINTEVVPPLVEDTAIGDVATPAKPKRHRAGKKRKQNENKDEIEQEQGSTVDKSVEETNIEIKEIKHTKETPIPPTDMMNKIIKGEDTVIEKSVIAPEREKVETQKILPRPKVDDAITEKPVISQIDEKVALVARKKKGNYVKNESENLTETPKSESIKEKLMQSMQKPKQGECIEPTIQQPTGVCALPNEQEIKSQDPREEHSASHEPKGGKKKNKKTQKFPLDSVMEIPKAANTCEQKAEIMQAKTDIKYKEPAQKQEEMNIQEISNKDKQISEINEPKCKEDLPIKIEDKQYCETKGEQTKEIISSVKDEETQVCEIKEEHKKELSVMKVSDARNVSVEFNEPQSKSSKSPATPAAIAPTATTPTPTTPTVTETPIEKCLLAEIAEPVITEQVKIEEQQLCETKEDPKDATKIQTIDSPQIYETKQQFQAEAGKGKKKNKKDKKLHLEKHDDNIKIDVIIAEPLQELNVIVPDTPENILVTDELKKSLIAKDLPALNIISEEAMTAVPVTEIKGNIATEVQSDVKLDMAQNHPEIMQIPIPTMSLTGDDNNNIIVEEPVPIPEGIINTEFEKLLSKTSVPEISTQDVALPKDVGKPHETIPPETMQFTPLSERNIDESCIKLFESLLVTDKPIMTPLKENIDTGTSSKTETKKEEEFIIRLFEQSLASAQQTKPQNKPLIKEKAMSTGLKDRVMEVNKDMEDLKLSIEKSLAELTALEEDDMPEITAITDFETPPSETEKAEAITNFNDDTQKLPVSQTQQITQPGSTAVVEDTEIITLTEINKNELEIISPEISKEISLPEIVKPQEKAVEQQQHHKKGKGKGKSSKPQEPIITVNLEVKETSRRSKSPATPAAITPTATTPTPTTPTVTETLIEKCLLAEIAEPVITEQSGVVITEIIDPDITSTSEVKADIEVHDTQTSSHDHKSKGKGKNKKKNKNEQIIQQVCNTQGVQPQHADIQSSETQKTETTKSSEESKTEAKESEKQKPKDSKTATDQETKPTDDDPVVNKNENETNFKPENYKVENFEEGLTTSTVDDSNIFEEISGQLPFESTSIVIPIDDKDMTFENVEETDTKPPEENQIENPMCTRSKNLLGPPDIPVTSSKNDYKKEKNKNIQTPNTKQARIKIKDSVEIEKDKSQKSSKQSQTENKIKCKRQSKSSSPDSDNDDEEFIYKYSFRKVFLTNSCNVCKTELKGRRLPCGYCNLLFYCTQKHKDEDWPQHQALCFAVSTIVHLKGLKFIYADASGANGQDYRLLRMQVIVSCEKILKRKLLPCEQETLLYPRMCCDPGCREWRTGSIEDCEGCGLVAYCAEKPHHLIKDHLAWCKSYRLYFKLVTHQQSMGRLEPGLPSKVITDVAFRIPDKINELLAQVYEEKIDMDDVHYAALTQLATAPLTAAYSYQLFKNSIDNCPDMSNGHQTNIFTIHVVGAELQFEADTLNKWEVLFLHIRPDVQQLKIVFVGPELNPSKLPLDLLAKIKYEMCKQCRQDKRKIFFDYQDGQLYHNYVASKYYTKPDIVCAFNPGLHRITGFGGVDSWPETINCIIKQGIPFCVTSYTKFELPRDLLRVRECSKYQYKMIMEPTLNPYRSIRPDRNFISDDEMPLIFKNYYLMVLCGVE